MLISGRVRMDSEFFIWAGCVAYAMIAGLTVRILLLPTGTLAATPLPERLVACALALVVYFLVRRNLLVGIATGFVALDRPERAAPRVLNRKDTRPRGFPTRRASLRARARAGARTASRAPAR